MEQCRILHEHSHKSFAKNNIYKSKDKFLYPGSERIFKKQCTCSYYIAVSRLKAHMSYFHLTIIMVLDMEYVKKKVVLKHCYGAKIWLVFRFSCVIKSITHI